MAARGMALKSILLYGLVFLLIHKGTSSDTRKNILLISDNTFGHMAPLLSVGEELIQRGHNVSILIIVYEAEQEKVRNHVKNYGIYLWNVSSEDLPELNMSQISQNISRAFFQTMAALGKYGADFAMIMAKHMNRSLSAGDWDAVLGSDFMQPLTACLSSTHDVPFILIGHNSVSSFHLSPSWPWPSLMQGAVSDNMGFLDRVMSVPASLLTQAFSYIMFYHPINSLNEYCPAISLSGAVSAVGIHYPTIIPSVMGFEYPLTISPLVEHVGPLVPKHRAPLEGNLKEWLENKPDKSVVYISMGSMFSLDENSGRAFLNGVMQTNLSILWSLRKSNQDILKGLTIDPDRVLISTWTPQFSVLGSKAIHSAILHGGINGITEALWNGVPILVFPQMQEQLYNAGRVHFSRLGIHLDSKTLTSEKITESLRALDTGNYRSKISKLQKMYHLAGGVERAADLVEFYEAVGYAHLVPAYAKYQWSWVQYYNADVYALILLTLAVLAMCFRACCKRLCKCLSKRCLSTKDKEKKE